MPRLSSRVQPLLIRQMVSAKSRVLMTLSISSLVRSGFSRIATSASRCSWVTMVPLNLLLILSLWACVSSALTTAGFFASIFFLRLSIASWIVCFLSLEPVILKSSLSFSSSSTAPTSTAFLNTSSSSFLMSESSNFSISFSVNLSAPSLVVFLSNESYQLLYSASLSLSLCFFSSSKYFTNCSVVERSSSAIEASLLSLSINFRPSAPCFSKISPGSLASLIVTVETL